ncbi:MAG: cellulose synthase/poly-beta-1,6-N-acetylglucosamine synthase-like glycosyltransferase [Psychromonas sp.]|jgi:cellulose synthase/poly-beta-1,6-N-acetylglucosamine synthase-like glycosyltransferase|uniref:glycosyltransferase family 2 protein n=1 Tax=Psychromonas sp. TaxID=1884585 RepID=UPI0039E3D547
MNNFALLTLTLISGLLVIYHHVGYPLILRWVSKRRPNKAPFTGARHYTDSAADNTLPRITMVIPAYNEQQWIAEKVRNMAALDYPSSRLRVLIGCDGCSDNTYEIAVQTAAEVECQQLDIEIINFTENRGKVALLNTLIADLNCDLVALSDTSALLSIDALLIAAERFKDSKIGVLNGHYRLLSPGSLGEQTYWDYQSQIKSSEAALGSTLGAHGAFYVFRRALFTPLAADTINDDFILPMKIVAAGYRADYEQNITALELEKSNDSQDRQRRRRIAAGNFQQLLRLKNLFLPRHGGIAFAFISGKGLRVMMPFLMIIALLGSLLLAFESTLFMLLAGLQIGAYSVAGWELLCKPVNSHKLCRLLAYLVGGHIAGLIGTLRYLLRLDKGHWKKNNS